MNPFIQQVFTNATGTGVSAWVDTKGHYMVAMAIESLITPASATIRLEASPTGATEGFTFLSRNITARGVFFNNITAHYPFIRARISSYTSGRYNVWIILSGYTAGFIGRV